MKKLLALLALAAFAFAFAPAASARAQDDDHGKHKSWYKHGDDDDDDGYRHDNGKHKAGTSITTVASTTIGIMMASAFAPATTIRAAVTGTFGASLSSAASIRARGTSFSTTNPIGSSRPTTFLAAATGNGIATASMCMTTTAILAGTCCSIRASAVPFTSSSSACSRALTRFVQIERGTILRAPFSCSATG